MLKKTLFIGIVVLAFIATSSADQGNPLYLSMNEKQPSQTSGDSNSSKGAGRELAPSLRQDGKKFKIAIIRSGQYWQYAANFKTLLDAFIDYGWVNKIQLTEEALRTMPEMLTELRKQDYSNYIEFPSKSYFDFEFKEEKSKDPKFQAIIKDSKNIDLIISFGTRSGRVLSGEKALTIPVVAVQISDPLKAGIIESCNDSGNDFLTARCDPDKYRRQIKVFYDVIKFKRLGLIYEDTPAGRSIAALEHIENLSKEKGFSIIRNTKPIANGPEAPKTYLKGLEELAPQIDAMYLTIHGGLSLQNLPTVMSILNRYKVRSFSMEGPKFVKHGVLLSISSQERRATGEYNVQKIIRILKGAKARNLDQVFTITPMIAINLKEAMQIGYDPPVDILAASDEVYEDIAEPEAE